MENYHAIIAICSLIIFVAFFVRALSGFGSALISIGLLSLIFDVKFVVPLESILEVGLSLLLIKNVYKNIEKLQLVPLIVGAAIGSMLGLYFLHSLENEVLKKSLGIVIIIFALNLLRKNKKKVARAISSWWGIVCGILGGTLGGAFGTSSPPMIWYLATRLRQKDVLRATMIGLFSVDFIWRLTIYACTGLLTAEMLKLAVFLSPALIAGTYLGHRVQLKISEQGFHQIVVVLLVASGLLCIYK